MSVKRIYECSLCNDRQDPDRLIGLYWTSAYEYLVEKPAREVEHHICEACATAIRIIMEKKRR